MSAMGFSADSARPAVLYGCAKVPISALNCAVLKCSVLLPRSHYTVLLVVGVCDNSHYQRGENVVHLRQAICQLLQSNADGEMGQMDCRGEKSGISGIFLDLPIR